jgi:hypothetical protein
MIIITSAVDNMNTAKYYKIIQDKNLVTDTDDIVALSLPINQYY